MHRTSTRARSSTEGTTAGRIAPEVIAIGERLFGRENVDPYHGPAPRRRGARALGGARRRDAREGPPSRRRPAARFPARRSSARFKSRTVLRGVSEGRGDRAHRRRAGTVEREIAGVPDSPATRAPRARPRRLPPRRRRGRGERGRVLPAEPTRAPARRAARSPDASSPRSSTAPGARQCCAPERTFAVTRGPQAISALVACRTCSCPRRS
jgi:hypothetical protein